MSSSGRIELTTQSRGPAGPCLLCCTIPLESKIWKPRTTSESAAERSQDGSDCTDLSGCKEPGPSQSWASWQGIGADILEYDHARIMLTHLESLLRSRSEEWECFRLSPPRKEHEVALYYSAHCLLRTQPTFIPKATPSIPSYSVYRRVFFRS